jgi:alpha-tubulin suppressor-like RCC1 family protein
LSCEPGEYVLQEPDEARDRLCVRCPNGSTTATANQAHCAPIRATQISSDYYHSCARFDDGSARCWGYGVALGVGEMVHNVGDDELPSAEDPVHVSQDPTISVVQVATGVWHSCAWLSDDSVKCWGLSGRLGQGNSTDVYDPSTEPSIALGKDPNDAIEQLVTGEGHNCVRLASGQVRCWGLNQAGQLGQGNVAHIGDDELPSSVAAVSVSAQPGVKVTQLAAGAFYTCAILSTGAIKCWGDNDSQQLGYGDNTLIGDDELPSSVDDVRVSQDPTLVPTQIVAGYAHTCVLLSDYSVKCWGRSREDYAGDGPLPQKPVDLPPLGIATQGTHVVSLDAGYFHTCALLSNHAVKCWGNGGDGQLGYGSTSFVRLPDAGIVSVLDNDDSWVTELSGGGFHTCALLSDGHVKCWGWNIYGMLGQGNTDNIGDDELPSSIGPIQFF